MPPKRKQAKKELVTAPQSELKKIQATVKEIEQRLEKAEKNLCLMRSEVETPLLTQHNPGDYWKCSDVCQKDEDILELPGETFMEREKVKSPPYENSVDEEEEELHIE